MTRNKGTEDPTWPKEVWHSKGLIVFLFVFICKPVFVPQFACFSRLLLSLLSSERCVLDLKLLSVYSLSFVFILVLCLSFCVVPVYSPVPPVLAASNKLCQCISLCHWRPWQHYCTQIIKILHVWVNMSIVARLITTLAWDVRPMIGWIRFPCRSDTYWVCISISGGWWGCAVTECARSQKVFHMT